MAIVYLYPVHPPVRVLPEVPEGFELSQELIDKFPAKSADDYLIDLTKHRAFTKPEHRDQRAAILLAIEERKTRLEKDPEGPDYYAVTREVAKLLQMCISAPVFLTMTDGQMGWERGFVCYTPDGAAAFAVFEEMIKRPKDLKPVKTEKVESVTDERQGERG